MSNSQISEARLVREFQECADKLQALNKGITCMGIWAVAKAVYEANPTASRGAVMTKLRAELKEPSLEQSWLFPMIRRARELDPPQTVQAPAPLAPQPAAAPAQFAAETASRAPAD